MCNVQLNVCIAPVKRVYNFVSVYLQRHADTTSLLPLSGCIYKTCRDGADTAHHPSMPLQIMQGSTSGGRLG